MTDKNYKIDRDNIYVGQVMKTFDIYRNKDKMLELNGFYVCRSMLFVKTEEKQASDLLYNTSDYPILNVSEDRKCCSSPFVVDNIYNLSKLLQYFGYPEELTIEHIIEIRKKYFDGKFVKENCKLFGWAKKNQNNFDKLLQVIYEDKGNGVLPSELFTILNENGNKKWYDFFFGDSYALDPFTPHLKEGNVKKLTKFKKNFL